MSLLRTQWVMDPSRQYRVLFLQPRLWEYLALQYSHSGTKVKAFTHDANSRGADITHYNQSVSTASGVARNLEITANNQFEGCDQRSRCPSQLILPSSISRQLLR